MKFNFNVKKLLSVSIIMYMAIALLSLVSLIVYSINIASKGFFQGASVPGVVALSLVTFFLSLVVVASTFCEADGLLNKVLEIVLAVIKVVVPCLLLIVTIKIVGQRVDGFGYIFFSNADVKKEVATKANLSSAYGSIAAIICFCVTGITSIVASFFKKEA